MGGATAAGSTFTPCPASVRVVFADRIRDQRTFDSPGLLTEQMGRDCQAVRAILIGDASGADAQS